MRVTTDRKGKIMKMSKKLIAGGITATLLLIGIIVLAVNMPKEAAVSGNHVVTSGNAVSDSQVATGQVSAENNNTDTNQGTQTNVSNVTENQVQDTNDTVSSDEIPESQPESTESSNEVSNPETSAVPDSSVATETGTPVANHGELSVQGTQIVDAHGNPYQLKGVSTHGIGWFPEYVNKDAFQTLRDEWGANCVRLAMYVAEYNGYCEGGNQQQLKQLVSDGVSYATELGMYVIIDWHVLHDLDPNNNKAAAIAFFDEMSEKYADYDNVIYEICNEPNGGTSWSSIKSYALEVIPVIKANNPDAIIVVGTPTWSQDVDVAANDPITGYSNIMYTIHFYADTHRDSLRQKMQTALNAGLPLFCTEFGITDASGNGAVNIDEANKWIDAMDSAGVSYCIWSLCNKNESSALILSSCSKTSGWTINDLSEEGKWYVGILGGTASGTTGGNSSGNTGNNTGNNDNNTNHNNSSNNNTNNGNSSQTVTASSANTQATISSSGGWDSGSGKCYQYTVTINNTGSSAVSNWSVTVNFGTNVTLDQSWNGNYSLSGSNLTITPVDFNSTINAGQSVEVGFIISSSGTIQNPTISVN